MRVVAHSVFHPVGLVGNEHTRELIVGVVIHVLHLCFVSSIKAALEGFIRELSEVTADILAIVKFIYIPF